MTDRQNQPFSAISPAMRRLIAALLAERDLRSACRAAGIAERTGQRWMTDPGFRAELGRVEGETIENLTRRLLALQEVALTTLRANLGARRPADQIRAAAIICDRFLRWRELAGLEERVRRLEEASGKAPK